MVQDDSSLVHLDQERRLPAGDSISGTDPGEDPICQRNARPVRGHERTTVGHQRDQTKLS